MRIKEIKIQTKTDFIILEKYDEVSRTIPVGTRLFCGCCGKIFGETLRILKFPFSSNTFIKNSKLENCDTCGIGMPLHHKTCGHRMFSFVKGWSFISAKLYFEQAQSHKHFQ